MSEKRPDIPEPLTWLNHAITAVLGVLLFGGFVGLIVMLLP